MRHPTTIAALALALAACERSTALPACPGDVQVRLQLATALADVEGSAACAAAALPRDANGAIVVPGPTPAALSFTAADGAAVCVERTLADPLLGTRTGDVLTVAAPPEAVAVTACGCAVNVVERLAGTILRDASGAAVGFQGELVDELAPADAAFACPPTGADPCPVPCRIHFTVQGVP